jgi:hypothetical protein
MPLPPFVIPRFNPAEIPGLHSWWDAADAASVTLDSGRVSQLSDKSGNARHLTNTTSGSTQPSYVTEARNGLNVARFAAASVQRLSVPSSTATYKFLHDGTPCWWIAVCKFGTVANPGVAYTLFSTAAASAQIGTVVQYSDDPSYAVNNGASFAVNRAVQGSFTATTANPSGSQILPSYQSVFPANTTLVTDCLFDVGNAVASERIALSVNGGTAIKGNTRAFAPSTANATYNLSIGSFFYLGSFYDGLQGDLCELMFFSQRPTDAARDLIRRYLGAKWGVTIA